MCLWFLKNISPKTFGSHKQKEKIIVQTHYLLSWIPQWPSHQFIFNYMSLQSQLQYRYNTAWCQKFFLLLYYQKLTVLNRFKMKEGENLKKLYTLYSTQYFDCGENYRLIWISYKVRIILKVQQSHNRPRHALRVPGGWGPRFQDSWHMKVVMLPALHTGHLYPPGNIPGTLTAYLPSVSLSSLTHSSVDMDSRISGLPWGEYRRNNIVPMTIGSTVHCRGQHYSCLL
jgi:hypothetical protein